MATPVMTQYQTSYWLIMMKYVQGWRASSTANSVEDGSIDDPSDQISLGQSNVPQDIRRVLTQCRRRPHLRHAVLELHNRA